MARRSSAWGRTASRASICGNPRASVLRLQPFTFAVSREEAFRKVDTLFQVTDSLFQLIELRELRLQVFCLRRKSVAPPRALPVAGRHEPRRHHLQDGYDREDRGDTERPFRDSEHRQPLLTVGS